MDDLNSVSHTEMIETLDYLNTRYGNEEDMITQDRTLAIKWIIEQSNPDDWIIITGKGHKKYHPANSDKDTVLYDNQLDKYWSSKL